MYENYSIQTNYGTNPSETIVFIWINPLVRNGDLVSDHQWVTGGDGQ